jgi:hypothetical protein
MIYKQINDLKELNHFKWEHEGQKFSLRVERKNNGGDGLGTILYLFIKNLSSISRNYTSDRYIDYDNFVYSDDTELFISKHNLEILKFFGLELNLNKNFKEEINMKKNEKILINGEKYLYIGKLEDEDAYLLINTKTAELILVTQFNLEEAIKLGME